MIGAPSFTKSQKTVPGGVGGKAFATEVNAARMETM